MIKEKSFVSAVVYIRNNQNEIKDFFSNLCNILDKNFLKYEIICVDDGSTDKSIEILKSFFRENTKCTVNLISMGYYQGVEAAMNAGIDISIGDMVFEFDCLYADYNFSLIMDVYYKAQEGYDIVGAAPADLKRVTSDIFYKILCLDNTNIKNMRTETFRIVSRRAINRVNAMNLTVPFRQIAYSTCGLKQYVLEYKSVRKSTPVLNSSYRRRLAMSSIVLFTDIGFNISMVLAIMFFIIGMIKIVMNKYRTAGINSFFAGGIFVTLGVIIKYLEIIKELVFKRQTYIVSNVEKVNNIA